MDESRGWTVDGVEWTDFATLAMQEACPIVDARKPMVTSPNPRITVKGSRVRTRRVHPGVMRRMKEASGG